MKRYPIKFGAGYMPTAPHDWQRDADCAGEPLELFYGPDGERSAEREIREAEALDLCWGCSVRIPCLEDALIPANTGQHGVRGGMTAEERIVERRNRMRRVGRAA